MLLVLSSRNKGGKRERGYGIRLAYPVIRELDSLHPDSALVANHDGVRIPFVLLQIALLHGFSAVSAHHKVPLAVDAVNVVVADGNVPFAEKKNANQASISRSILKVPGLKRGTK